MIDIEQIAKTCHQVNKVYCQAIGDNSQPDWKDAPDWQKESVIAGVQNILDWPGTIAEDSHAIWVAYKEKEGWIYGPVNDPDKKTHPNIVPFNQLLREQRFKDELFIAVVKSFM